MNKICLYAIAKNESKNVDDWYESVKEADAVAVLDTGSTDDTVAKLKSHGIIVGEKKYDQFRFDQARNDSMELIPEDCNIRFTIDLDERLEPGWSDIVRKEWIDGVHERGNYSYIFQDEGHYEISRNWMHSKNWSWLYPCHEVMKRNGSIWYTEDEQLDLHGKVVVHHWPDPSKPRSSYMDLLKLRLDENPDDDMSYVYLLREKWIYRQYLEIASHPSRIYREIQNFGPQQRAAALVYLGDALCAISDTETGIRCYRDAIWSNPEARAGYIRMAKVLIRQRRYREAKDVLIDCEKRSQRSVKWVWVDTNSMWGYELYDLLAQACLGLGEYSEAVEYGTKASEMEPSNSQLRKNLTTYQSYAKRNQNGR